jgi:hypothetical protein
VNEAPRHIVPLFTEMTGRVFTVTVATPGTEDTQPKELVPVTEYEEVADGVTTEEPLLNV